MKRGKKSDDNPLRPARRARSFTHAGRLVSDRVRAAGEGRGFAVARLLTHWTEVAGEDIARLARPVKVAHRREGLGATLTLLTTGAAAPLLQLQLPVLRERVNACYGYNAIARIVLTQTAAEGLAESAAAFDHKPPSDPDPMRPDIVARAAEATHAVTDPALRAALEALARNVYARQQTGAQQTATRQTGATTAASARPVAGIGPRVTCPIRNERHDT